MHNTFQFDTSTLVFAVLHGRRNLFHLNIIPQSSFVKVHCKSSGRCIAGHLVYCYLRLTHLGVLSLLLRLRNTQSFMSSCEDLFQSFSRKVDISNISSDLFADSSTESLGVKLEKPKDKQNRVIHSVGKLIPDFSSYEKHELVVESDISNHTSCFHHQIANRNEERTTPPEYHPNLVVKTKSYDIFNSSSAAFCSTPGPSNSLSTLKSLKNTHDLPAPKIVSGDVLVNTLQVTPIHPVFPNRKSTVNFKMGNISSQVNGQQTLTSSDHSMSTHHKNKLVVTHGVDQMPSSHVLQCFNLSTTSTNQQIEHDQIPFQSSFSTMKKVEAGKKSGSYTKRLTRRFRCENMILNRSYMTLYEAGDIKGTLFKICEQSDYKTFGQLFIPSRRKNLSKIGEGCFGEVFRCPDESNPTEYVVIKLIPIEGNIKFNGESQKSFSEVLSEVIVSKELTALGMGLKNNTCGFVELKKVHLIQGSFPAYLKKAWDKYDKEKKSENDNPSIFPKTQLWVALESAFCGVTLENNVPICPCARLSILLQIGISLAVAELELKFEHRDLHWDGYEWNIPKFGYIVHLIDFTMSRLEQDEGLVYVDLSTDPTLFKSQGDYQFDIYRHMKSANQ
ncbi:kinase, putative [Schistosoma mansoni]|uniref:kinase, putative n=1 Tax=Schistosoma mansoni TaxID=6183 RepID=UPI00022C82E6|nr:kinase, putative [Schistosoma mansoni]|eukprot:XP_018646803.1 kinase, putative [Schistosoma mansoni]